MGSIGRDKAPSKLAAATFMYAFFSDQEINNMEKTDDTKQDRRRNSARMAVSSFPSSPSSLSLCSSSESDSTASSNADSDSVPFRKGGTVHHNLDPSTTATSHRTMVDQGAVQFGTRLSVLLFISSLFEVVQINGKSWPQASWVIVTTLFVSWFPSMDATSVIEKITQRCMGTLVGGLMGLLLGAICSQVDDLQTRVIFVDTCFVIGVYLVCFCSVQFRLSRTTKFIQRYSYASCLCLLTYTLSIFPFQEAADDPWQKAVYRVANVAIGSFLGTVGSVMVWPRSPSSLMYQRINKQCQLAGQASEAILLAAVDVFSSQQGASSEDQKHPSKQHAPPTSPLLNDAMRINKALVDEGFDVAHEKYESAIKDWRITKGLFSLFTYDPFHYFLPFREEIQNRCAACLERALRVQTTVVLMDGVIRNEPQGYWFDEEELAIFTEIGSLCRKMLHANHSFEGSGASRTFASKELLMERLAAIRELSSGISREVSETEASLIRRSGSSGGDAMSTTKRHTMIYHDDSRRHALLFLQLVEHLALRCISLHDSWQEAQAAPAAHVGQPCTPKTHQKPSPASRVETRHESRAIRYSGHKRSNSCNGTKTYSDFV